MLCKSWIGIWRIRTQYLIDRRKARSTWDTEGFTKRSRRQARSQSWTSFGKKKSTCHPSAMILNRCIDQRKEASTRREGTHAHLLARFSRSLPLKEGFILNLGRRSLKVNHTDLMRESILNTLAARDKNAKRRSEQKSTSASRSTKRSTWTSLPRATSSVKKGLANICDHRDKIATSRTASSIWAKWESKRPIRINTLERTPISSQKTSKRGREASFIKKTSITSTKENKTQRYCTKWTRATLRCQARTQAI